jgi:hypothetical protein
VYWRAAGPDGRGDAFYSVAALLIFAWVLGAMGVYEIGAALYILLGIATVLVAMASLRRRV